MESFPPVLDACCGPRHFWFNKADNRARFMDARSGEFPMPKGRKAIVVRPDVVADFTRMPFPDESFYHVVFDPPHHTSKQLGTKHVSIMQATYGILPREGWEDMLRAGFAECFRVLKPNGTLIFKWGGREIGVRQAIKLALPYRPLFGHQTRVMASGGATHWITFLKA